ncbi:Protein of unknown function DUF3007 [Dillenia turbinata]|uniref:Uncharacterized protein n=1 Tax=Dillenia turbinata TaxID=194707 RepID=A0AAN8UT53_9MAGN
MCKTFSRYNLIPLSSFSVSGGVISKRICSREASDLPRKGFDSMLRNDIRTVPRCSGSSSSNSSKDSNLAKACIVFVEYATSSSSVILFCASDNLHVWSNCFHLYLQQTPFGYTRKDVLLIGLGVTFFGVDPLQAGNVVQLVLVLGLIVGWISTYMFRVSNKEMTYAQQLLWAKCMQAGGGNGEDWRDSISNIPKPLSKTAMLEEKWIDLLSELAWKSIYKRLESLTEAELEALLEQVEEEKRTLGSSERVN